MSDEISFYSKDYFTARTRFLEAARTASATLFSLPISTSTPDLPEPLAIEIAVLGSLSAPHKILHISGTHGVEGYVGSAIQLALLSKGIGLPTNCAVLFVHALNPWGMAMVRRTNEANVDLNRNALLDDGKRVGGTRHYQEIREMLLPRRSLSYASFLGRAVVKILRYGFPAVKQAVTGGQFEDQDGLFFGGAELQPELQLLRGWINAHVAGTKRLISIDVHTGLGEWGNDVLLLDVPESHDEFSRVAARFGRDKVQGPDPKTSIAYETTGTLSNLIYDSFRGAVVDCIVQEFGTYSGLKVLHALRQENYRFHNSTRCLSERPDRQLQEVFVPADREWRERVVERGIEVFRRALTSSA